MANVGGVYTTRLTTSKEAEDTVDDDCQDDAFDDSFNHGLLLEIVVCDRGIVYCQVSV